MTIRLVGVSAIAARPAEVGVALGVRVLRRRFGRLEEVQDVVARAEAEQLREEPDRLALLLRRE